MAWKALGPGQIVGAKEWASSGKNDAPLARGLSYELEFKTDCKLHDTSGCGQARDPGKVRAVDAVELAINRELSMVQNVKEFSPQLDFHGLIDPNVLDQRAVKIKGPGSIKECPFQTTGCTRIVVEKDLARKGGRKPVRSSAGLRTRNRTIGVSIGGRWINKENSVRCAEYAG